MNDDVVEVPYIILLILSTVAVLVCVCIPCLLGAGFLLYYFKE